MKKILFNITKLPYDSIVQEENIETILFAASFGLEVAVIFSEQGIWQLLSSQAPVGEQKSIAKMISAFPTFDIKHIYASKEHVMSSGLKQENFSVQPQLVSTEEILQLMQQADYVINY